MTGQTKQAAGDKRQETRKNLIEKAIAGSSPFETIFSTETVETEKSAVSTEPYSFPQEIQPNLFIAEEKILAGRRESSLSAKLSPAHFLGSFINKFLLFESDRSLFVID